MAIYSLKQRIFMVKRYYQNGNSTEQVQDEFIIEFNQNKPTDENIVELVVQFENFGSVINPFNNTELEVDTHLMKLQDAVSVEDPMYNSLEIEPVYYIAKHEIDPLEHNNADFSESSECDPKYEIDSTEEIADDNTEELTHNGTPSCSEGSPNWEADDTAKEKTDYDIANWVNSDKDHTINTFHKPFKCSTNEPNLLGNAKVTVKCELCSKEFLSISLLNDHFKTHTNENRSTHIETDTVEEPFNCSICNEQFNTINNLNSHKRIHSDAIYKCDVCEKSFRSYNGLYTHIRRVHIGKRPHQCSLCDKKFYSKTSLVIHERVHTGEKPYVCSHCPRGFGDVSTCRRHERTHTGERPYKCKLCGKTFAQVSGFKSHMTNVHNQNSNSGNKQKGNFGTNEHPNHINCEICSKSFSTKGILTAHMKKHTGEKPYICQLCDKQFTSNFNLTIHKRTHTGEKPFICDICGKSFTASSFLKMHTSSVHTSDKPYECPSCDKKFPYRKSLILHKRTHTGEKPYSCAYCSKAFISSTGCRRHEETHTGDKRHTCICGKAFNQLATLKNHMKNIHIHEANK